MPDITMCPATPKTCPLAADCYRALAKPTRHRQAYFCAPPVRGNSCAYFTPVEKSGRRLRVVRSS